MDTKAGKRVRLFVIGIIAATVGLPILFGSVFGSDKASSGGSPTCLARAVEAFEQSYGEALVSEVLGMEAACEDRSSLTAAELRELREQP